MLQENPFGKTVRVDSIRKEIDDLRKQLGKNQKGTD